MTFTPGLPGIDEVVEELDPAGLASKVVVDPLLATSVVLVTSVVVVLPVDLTRDFTVVVVFEDRLMVAVDFDDFLTLVVVLDLILAAAGTAAPPIGATTTMATMTTVANAHMRKRATGERSGKFVPIRSP